MLGCTPLPDPLRMPGTASSPGIAPKPPKITFSPFSKGAKHGQLTASHRLQTHLHEGIVERWPLCCLFGRLLPFVCRFSVYITIPLFPEGDPKNIAVQAQLFWQSETFRMMYAKVHQALRNFGPADAQPSDYLSVFCLAYVQLPAP